MTESHNDSNALRCIQELLKSMLRSATVRSLDRPIHQRILPKVRMISIKDYRWHLSRMIELCDWPTHVRVRGYSILG